MNKLTITVEGQLGTGKSTIAQMIQEFLEWHEINASLHFINDEHPPRSPNNLQKAFESLRERGLEIEVIEKQKQRV